MIIELNDDLFDVFNQKLQYPKNAKITNFIEDICLSSYKGYNYLVISPDLCDLILSNFDQWSPRVKEILFVIKKNYPEKKSFSNEAKFKLIIKNGIINDYIMKDNYIYIKFNKMIDCDLTKKPNFLIENSINDELIYKKIINYYKINYNLKTNIAYNVKNGGGSTTGPIFKGYQDQDKEFIFCLVDSDKKSPNGRLGDTAKSIKRINKKEKLLSILYYSEEFQEIENLISLNILKKLNLIDKNHLFLDEMNDEMLNYFDFKNGITCGKLKQLNDFNYWLNNIKFINKCETLNAICNKCGSNCFSLTGYNKKFLENVLANSTNLITDKRTEKFISQIGERLFFYFCSDNLLRV